MKKWQPYPAPHLRFLVLIPKTRNIPKITNTTFQIRITKPGQNHEPITELQSSHSSTRSHTERPAVGIPPQRLSRPPTNTISHQPMLKPQISHHTHLNVTPGYREKVIGLRHFGWYLSPEIHNSALLYHEGKEPERGRWKGFFWTGTRKTPSSLLSSSAWYGLVAEEQTRAVAATAIGRNAPSLTLHGCGWERMGKSRPGLEDPERGATRRVWKCQWIMEMIKRRSGGRMGWRKKTQGCSSGWRGVFLCWISAASMLQYALAFSSSCSVFLSPPPPLFVSPLPLSSLSAPATRHSTCDLTGRW